MSEEKPEDVTVPVPPGQPSDSDDFVPPAASPPGGPPIPPGGPPPPSGGFPPPPPFGGAGFPPPGGFPPPPPGTSGWATRYGLVRPARGRVLAGVCAAIGRATNTDPVLWRVLFAVLTLAGGMSIFVYVVAWLLIPAEGDTGSPLEALLGRGRSSTSPVLVVIVSIITMLAVGSAVFGHHLGWLVVGALIVGALFVANRSTASRSGAQPTYPTPVPGETPPTASFEAAPADPTTGTGYRPPFAPHGPYMSSPYPYPGLGVPSLPAPAKPAPPPSRLGRFTLSLALLGIGIVALVDVLSHGRVLFAAYVAVALAAVALGLLVGAWFGRARSLIVFGALLSVLLLISSAVGGMRLHGSAGDIRWAPVTMADLSDRYEHGVGDADLDLSQLSFDGLDKQVTVRLGAGNLRVRVPPKVDVVVHAKVGVGDANVFDQHWDGVNNPQRTITDAGAPGAGHLILDLRVNAGSMEVNR
jgi:phage shock protein PspC (stress-responsive transcriptional regulator)